MEPRFLPSTKRDNWLGQLAREYTLFFPARVEKKVHWHRLEAEDLESGDSGPEWGLCCIRASEPIKSFLFSPREQVASFPDRLEPEEPEKRILFGVKDCDLLGLKVHEKMFLEGDFKDPFYEARLKNTILIAADCPDPEDSCFCNLVGRKPYATEGADIVLSVLDNGYLLEPLTEQGEELVRLGGDAFQPGTEAQIARRDEQRKAAVEKLEKTNPKPWNPEVAKAMEDRTKDQAFWRKHAATCVECFGCLMSCPTCFCFLLYAKAKEAKVERTRIWDACYLAAYARVGGGANPRAEFLKRFINRFQCKFMHFKNQHGFYACSGCGRCFKVCMGKIDIRKVLGEL